MSRPLDRHKPLWEVYCIEGLEDGKVAVLSKSHEVLVDGVHTVDLAQVLLDRTPEPRPMHHDDWRPFSAPSPTGLVAGAVQDSVTDPATVLETARTSIEWVLRSADAFAARAGAVAAALGTPLGNRRPSGDHPLSGHLSQQRRVITVRTALHDYLDVRQEHGGASTTSSSRRSPALCAAGCSAARSRSSGIRHIRTVVPVSVSDPELETTSLGSPIIAYFVDLPVGEASPVVRLHQVSYAFKAHKETGRGVAANRLTGIAGFAPSTFHAIGARVAADEARRGFQLSVTNVPGPQSPLFAAGARMLETYPVHPLLPGHALAIGVTSYDGHVFYGITADRDRIPDAEVLGQCVPEALAELLDTIGGRTRAPRGRRTKKTGKRTR